MPARPWPLWLLTGLVAAGFPAINFVYWPQVLRSGVLPPHGDSIGIPMLGSILFTLVASPIVLGVAWLCLRRYNPSARVSAWRRDRPYRSILATLTFGAGAAFLSAAALSDLAKDLPWYEYLWSGYSVIAVLWLLALRAAVVEQLEFETTYTRD